MPVTTFYCDDEAIIGRASRDYALLVPDHARIATGDDGAFLATARWTLTSAVPFLAQGVRPGQAAILKQHGVRSGRFGEDGEIFLVNAVADGAITLRRPGFQAGEGEPPGAITGTTGVSFLVTTMAQTIESVSYRINAKYGIDEKFALRAPKDLYDLREVEELCILWVLKRLCLDAWKNDRTKGDLWLDKAHVYEAEIDDLVPSIVLRWGIQGDSQSPSTYFSTHLAR